EIDGRNTLTGFEQRDRDVHRRRGFAGAALFVADHNDARRRRTNDVLLHNPGPYQHGPSAGVHFLVNCSTVKVFLESRTFIINTTDDVSVTNLRWRWSAEETWQGHGQADRQSRARFRCWRARWMPGASPAGPSRWCRPWAPST